MQSQKTLDHNPLMTSNSLQAETFYTMPKTLVDTHAILSPTSQIARNMSTERISPSAS